jgi:hypothetical protein
MWSCDLGDCSEGIGGGRNLAPNGRNGTYRAESSNRSIPSAIIDMYDLLNRKIGNCRIGHTNCQRAHPNLRFPVVPSILGNINAP